MISIFDWERLDSGKDWTFVLRKKIRIKYGENAAHINHVNKKALNYFQYYRLKIDCNGEMEFEATYQIGNLLNIKYEYNEKDYLDGRTFVYYVGAKSKRLAYPNACCMRKVISLGEELEYEEALPLMAVEFVRNSQYTVLPFPFKYLREYIEQC